MENEKLDLLKMKSNERVKLISEIKEKLNQKATQAKLQQSSSKIDNVDADQTKTEKQDHQWTQSKIESNTCWDHSPYLFMNLRWSLR